MANAVLNTVLNTRKNECNTTTSVSFDLKPGNATLNEIADSCLINAASIFGFDLTDEGIDGK